MNQYSLPGRISSAHETPHATLSMTEMLDMSMGSLAADRRQSLNPDFTKNWGYNV